MQENIHWDLLYTKKLWLSKSLVYSQTGKETILQKYDTAA